VNANVGQLARWQVAIYRLHDAERFDELAETASNIFIALGNSDRVAKVVGHRISTAYQLADQAQNAFQSGNRSDEREGYRQACESLENAALLLGLPPGVAVSQVKWWHRYRHKQKLAVIRHVLMQHMHHINLRGVLLLPLIIDAMLQIGRAHDSRDHAGAVAAAERYWSIMRRAYGSRAIPYLG
jgi:hypothetical protein